MASCPNIQDHLGHFPQGRTWNVQFVFESCQKRAKFCVVLVCIARFRSSSNRFLDKLQNSVPLFTWLLESLVPQCVLTPCRLTADESDERPPFGLDEFDIAGLIAVLDRVTRTRRAVLPTAGKSD